MNAITIQLYLQVGQRRYPIKDYAQASAMCNAARDASGLGASQIDEQPLIVDESGKVVAYVSYNGRVWAGDKYVPGAKPLFG